MMTNFIAFILILLLIICMIIIHNNSKSNEYMSNTLYGFIPEGYGNIGQYYDNSHIVPLYNLKTIPL